MMPNSDGVHPHEQSRSETSPAATIQGASHTTRNRISDTMDIAVACPHQDAKRRRLFADLYLRFYSQIKNGCSNPACATRTCQSYRRRISQGPFRPYTELTSRALAAFLAGQENPARDLCPNAPASEREPHEGLKARTACPAPTVPPGPADDASDDKKKTKRKQKAVRFAASGNNTTKPTDKVNQKSNRNVESSQITNQMPDSMKADASLDCLPPKQQKKDLRSFTQVLFDTTSFRTLHSTPREEVELSSCLTPSLPTSATHGRGSRPNTPPTDKSSVTRRNLPKSQTQNQPPLSHFSLKFIDQLCLEIRNEEITSGFHEVKKYLRSIGHPTVPPRGTASPVGSTAQGKKLVLLRRSINHVLGSAENLVASFEGQAYAWGGSFGQTVFRVKNRWVHDAQTVMKINYFIEIWKSLHNLMQVDIHPTNILSNLRLSLSEVEQSRFVYYHPDYRVSFKMGAPRWHNRRRKEGSFDIADILHVINIALAALVASVPFCSIKEWNEIRRCRSMGRMLHIQDPEVGYFNKELPGVVDSLEDEASLSLMRQVTRLTMSYSIRGHQADKHHGWHEASIFKVDYNIFDAWMEYKIDDTHSYRPIQFREGISIERAHVHAYSAIIELLKTVILKEWDGKPFVPRYGVVAGAAGCLQAIHRHAEVAGLWARDFYVPFFVERLDFMETPKEWVNRPVDNESIHLFSYPFLFPPTFLLSYFRAANHAAMLQAYESSSLLNRVLTEMTFTARQSGPGVIRNLEQLNKNLRSFFVLEVSRSNLLTDAMNQLWRRERREMIKPLRVRIGAQEGEEGEDHGGVQQEFFRIAIGEALKADYGLFTTDSRTRMSWFQPGSLEPLYKFELLGLLTSLAVYNGLTLPFTFPLALYRNLLGEPVTKLEHIEDGWPDLTKGLSHLLLWNEGDVEEVFVRSYVFSADTPTGTRSFNMEQDFGGYADHPEHGAWYSSAEPDEREASMVTNKNRHMFVADYIRWLTYKSIAPWYQAFEKGFYTCLDRKAVSLFDPPSLKLLVEGSQEIDVDDLEKATTYDGFTAEDALIGDFWQIVRSFSPEQIRKLLEFVMASDRVPFDGISSIDFLIQRNGDDDARLPSSTTCFGRLLLPAYSSKEKLQERLCLAIENSQGFGTV